MLKTLNIKSVKLKKTRIRISGNGINKNDGKTKLDVKDEFDGNKIDDNEIRDNKVAKEKNH